jgi:preprotein translocase subunit SecE
MGVRISPPVLEKLTMSKIRTYFEETTTELVQKTSWPTWQELQESAMVVLAAAVIIALLVFAMDSSFKKLMELAYQLLNNL